MQKAFRQDSLAGGISRIVLAILVSILAAVSGCGRAPGLIGIDNPDIPVASVEGALQHKIYLATTRQPTETLGAFFSDKRAPNLGLASVMVSVPPTHQVGELSRPKRLPPDPRKEYAVIEPVRYDTDGAFIAEINRALATRPKGDRDILFYVHGYNNSTSDAVLRLAQFVQDSGFTGVPILFDWASAANLTRYVYDINSVLIARPQLLEMRRILDQTNAEGYNLFAHSMGGLLVMEALVAQVQKNNVDASGKLHNIVLASPDIDMDLFRTQIKAAQPYASRMFVLMSEDDSALNLSRRIAGGVPRVGAANAQELADLGVVAIDLTEIEDSTSGSHSKFSGSPEVVKLLGIGLNRNSRFHLGGRPQHLNELLQGIPIQIVF